MLKRILMICLLVGVTWAQKAKEGEEPPFPLEKAQWVDNFSKAPRPVFDTNSIYTGDQANLTRKIAVGKHFMGASDDTIRIISPQSGGKRMLVIATDTTSTEFGTSKFRIDTTYSFPSGATEMAVAVGDVDGDAYTDILTGDNAAVSGYVWLRWFEWDADLANWVFRDSIGVGLLDFINDIVIGDADNDGSARDIVFNLANNTNSAVMVAKWNGTSFDTTRITFGRTQRYRGVAIGDIVPELPGNEIYVTGGYDIAMAYWDGTSWAAQVLTTGLTACYDIAIGDVDPNLPGDEIAIVHSSTSYQVSVTNYVDGTFYIRAWTLYSTWGTQNNDIDIGDFLREMPGNEVVLSNTSTTATAYSLWFSILPGGTAYVGTLPKVATGADYGIKIADVNRFREGNELIISCNGNLVEVEQHIYSNDLALLMFQRTVPVLKPSIYDTIRASVINTGANTVSSVTFNISFQNWIGAQSYTAPVSIEPGQLTVIDVPVQMPGQLGIDTMYLSLQDDGNTGNNAGKSYIEVWDDSTVAASSFSDVFFPPVGWTSQILSGSYNWQRFTSGTSPTCSPLDAPAMAGYRSYSATGGSGARLATSFNVDTSPKKVILKFYMTHDNAYSTSYDSVYAEYSFDGVNYITAAGFQRYDPAVSACTWIPHEVEIGDFPPNTEIYVALRARSGYGNNMYVDSVRVFVTAATAADYDAEMVSITIPKPVICDEGVPVTVVVKNAGIEPITSLPLFYTTGDADTTWETFVGQIIAGMSVPYVFTQPFVPTDTGEVTLYAGVRLTGDTIPDNDVASTLIHVWPFAQELPYSTTFDEDWSNSTNPPFDGWRIVDGGSETPPVVNNNDWHRFSSTSPARTVARIYYSPEEDSDDWLISPRLTISDYGTYTLNFWHYYNDFSTSYPDSGQVMITFDDGANWTEITRYSNFDDSGARSIDLTPFIASQVGTAEYFRIGFHYGANDEFSWYVDDFSVSFTPDETPPVLSFIRQPQSTYDLGPDTVIFVVNDASPMYVLAYAVANDTIIGSYESELPAGEDTVLLEVPGQAPGTPIDGYIYVEDANGNYSEDQGSWWKLQAYAPGMPVATGVTEPTPGVNLTWAHPTQSLVYDGGIAYYWTDVYPGDILSVRFTPQYTPARVDSVVAQFYGTTGELHLRIYDDNMGIPGTVIFDTTITPPVYPNYLRLDLRNRNIIVTGDYHVGFEWTVQDHPNPLSDDGANTMRSLYYVGSEETWYLAGYDWLIRSAVTYLPQAGKYASGFVPVDLEKNLKLTRVKLPATLAADGEPQRIGSDAKNILSYTILKGTASGGPYDSIGTTSGVNFLDASITDGNTYYYVLRMDYTEPDTTVYSGEVVVTADFVAPAFSALEFDTGGVGDIWFSIDITDPSGIFADSLYYSVNGGTFGFSIKDSVVESTYYYHISGLNIGDMVDIYFVAMDNSLWHNFARFPETGYITFGVTPVKDELPLAYAFNIKGSNVFSRSMDIVYALPERAEVEIAVYSISGQRVATLLPKTTKDAGYYTVTWNGRGDSGSKLGSGIYIVKMLTPKKSFTHKIILAR
ncbi:MAG: T9SS type A sorting domain-containing protein [Candidatus Hydrothermae bacterium]|nr:T9SS type A sorting domain-containing protein [Candidatus Hydrothermae bacterium]